jgi:quercetin dioxygenase-like cupin family protein
MARAGEEIYNPIIQDRVVFLKTARDTDGELLRVDLFLSPHGGNPMHIHPHQEEYFKVLSGTFGVQVGEEQRSLAEGEEALVPPATPHRFFNDTDEEAHQYSLRWGGCSGTKTTTPSTAQPRIRRRGRPARRLQ